MILQLYNDVLFLFLNHIFLYDPWGLIQLSVTCKELRNIIKVKYLLHPLIVRSTDTKTFQLPDGNYHGLIRIPFSNGSLITGCFLRGGCDFLSYFLWNNGSPNGVYEKRSLPINKRHGELRVNIADYIIHRWESNPMNQSFLFENGLPIKFSNMHDSLRDANFAHVIEEGKNIYNEKTSLNKVTVVYNKYSSTDYRLFFKYYWGVGGISQIEITLSSEKDNQGNFKDCIIISVFDTRKVKFLHSHWWITIWDKEGKLLDTIARVKRKFDHFPSSFYPASPYTKYPRKFTEFKERL